MESHWFIRFSIYFTEQGKFYEVKGNAVFKLPTDSFMPGSVIRTLKKFYHEQLAKKGRAARDMEAYIDSIVRVDEAGAKDFIDEKNDLNLRYSIDSREYSIETKFTVLKTKVW